LAKGGSLGCIDHKMLTGSAFAFECDSGSRVDNDREPRPSRIRHVARQKTMCGEGPGPDTSRKGKLQRT
jgi:hypothetical protein